MGGFHTRLDGVRRGEAESAAASSYVGGDSCVGCHQEESNAWQGSHHDLAMQVPSEGTVLGDFSGVTLEYYGRSSSFFRRDGAFFVNTEGSDGELHDYRIAYTFGASPLQQYLIQFPGGKLQALGIAWDARSRSEGGQRWYHSIPTRASRLNIHFTGPARSSAGTTSAPSAIRRTCRRTTILSWTATAPRGATSTCPARRAMAQARHT